MLTLTPKETVAKKGKPQIDFGGKSFILEPALRSDFALIHAFLAGHLGNLSYARTAADLNSVMAKAADTVIVTAEHIVPVGVIAADHLLHLHYLSIILLRAVEDIAATKFVNASVSARATWSIQVLLCCHGRGASFARCHEDARSDHGTGHSCP